MAISGRFVLLVLLGMVPVLLLPGWGTVLLVAGLLAALGSRGVSQRKRTPRSYPSPGPAASTAVVVASFADSVTQGRNRAANGRVPGGPCRSRRVPAARG